ncbi:13859_t:CDS:2 [Ambispora leptoticha]|uniref:13859_t:CDS:1 n=1 Tax=Ambispora leptoticha TaxID=144679 RepID=A0A9N8V8B5_9GLOM|nr:13859_t:CDS:2 [Ambispora leptoticha]
MQPHKISSDQKPKFDLKMFISTRRSLMHFKDKAINIKRLTIFGVSSRGDSNDPRQKFITWQVRCAQKIGEKDLIHLVVESKNESFEYEEKFACDIIYDPNDVNNVEIVNYYEKLDGLEKELQGSRAALIIYWLKPENSADIGIRNFSKNDKQNLITMTKDLRREWEEYKVEKETNIVSKYLEKSVVNYSFKSVRICEILTGTFNKYALKCILDRIINEKFKKKNVKGFIRVGKSDDSGSPSVHYVGFYVDRKEKENIIYLLGSRSFLFQYKPMRGLDHESTTSFLAWYVLDQVVKTDKNEVIANLAVVGAGYEEPKK